MVILRRIGVSIVKYNNKKVKVDGILFHSRMESMYYRHLQKLKKKGIVVEVELQPQFILLPTIQKSKRKYLKTCYKADFKVIYSDGRIDIVDVKGKADKVFQLKRKMFEFFYPDLELSVITLHDDRWIDYDEYEKLERLKKSSKGDSKRGTGRKTKRSSSQRTSTGKKEADL